METVASQNIYLTMIRLSVSELVEIFASLGLDVFLLIVTVDNMMLG